MNKTQLLACTCVSAILLTACSSHNGSGGDRQAELDAAIATASSGSGSGSGSGAAVASTSSGDGPSPEHLAFLENGFLDQDVATIAARMSDDIPNSPRLSRPGTTQNQILVDQQYIDVQEGATLNKSAFALRLLSELRKSRAGDITYVDKREASTSSSLSDSSSKSSSSSSSSSSKSGSGSGSGRRSGGQGGAAYRLECTVTVLAPTKEQPSVQRYAFQVVDTRTNSPIWMGDFDIDAPQKPAGAAQAK
ncbi:penicillin-binding protein activator LpoB [Azotobacter vinelandii]|uniref:penicillin-binding protein activator LpoB n=1 Tax=Azotobacter vinelandii TaxID=354 RepID=UPI002665BDE2|nr:penicillin-binding protein activator LpoB [Azotobacter vinelandii]WKN22087.1 penicillin-binding protein activator LpoB [Azotobacter vinelandii]